MTKPVDNNSDNPRQPGMIETPVHDSDSGGRQPDLNAAIPSWMLGMDRSPDI